MSRNYVDERKGRERRMLLGIGNILYDVVTLQKRGLRSPGVIKLYKTKAAAKNGRFGKASILRKDALNLSGVGFLRG